MFGTKHLSLEQTLFPGCEEGASLSLRQFVASDQQLREVAIIAERKFQSRTREVGGWLKCSGTRSVTRGYGLRSAWGRWSRSIPKCEQLLNRLPAQTPKRSGGHLCVAMTSIAQLICALWELLIGPELVVATQRCLATGQLRRCCQPNVCTLGHHSTK